MDIKPFHSDRGCLSYLVFDASSTHAVLIDPSEEVATQEYLQALADAKLTYIIETHTHADHISSAEAVREKTGAKILRHASAPSQTADVRVGGDEDITFGESSLRILATPGHTDESLSILVDGAVFTGDALLIGGTGRTDFQLGNSEDLYTSLHEMLGALPDDTVVYPAHDYKGRTSSTIGQEKQNNPRFALSHDEFVVALNAHHPPLPELFDSAIEANSK